MRVLPAATDLLASERVADAESNLDHRACLPAGRIALVRFALVEVEALTEDERPEPAGLASSVVPPAVSPVENW